MNGGGTKRWLVTGGVGFIGYHVSRALLLRGDRVTILDDFSDAPYPTVMKRRNAADLTKQFPRARITEGCVTERARLEALFEEPFDGVLHLAGIAGVRPSFADPTRYMRVNVEGTANVLTLARNAGIRRFVLASSSSVYGNSTPLPASEEEPAVDPESPYAASKRAAELCARAILKADKDKTVACAALRFFTVYGPRQRPEMAITLFTRAILNDSPIVMFGDGSMQRDFTHVDDIARGVLAALDGSPPGFRAYNLGSGAPIDLRALIDKIGELAEMDPMVSVAPAPIGDVEATFADISRAKTELGWQPLVPLDAGLKTVIEWVQANR